MSENCASNCTFPFEPRNDRLQLSLSENDMQKILIIDDAKENIVVLSRLLKTQANIIFALNGEEGITSAQSNKPDLILLDISMPGLNGFEVLAQLKKAPETSDIPVIFITGIPDSDTDKRVATS